MPDRVQQVGLAQPGLAVDEQRVVGLGRRLGHGHGGRVREAVGRADDEAVEGVLGVRQWARRGAAGAGLTGAARLLLRRRCPSSGPTVTRMSSGRPATRPRAVTTVGA